jgi:uncharacterized membrane protein YfcA
MSFWIWLAAPLIGLLLGLFGAGGGMLAVPLLIYGLGLPIKTAVATSLWIVAAVSLVAATQQRAWRILEPRLLGFFGLGGLVGGAMGAWIGSWINPLIQETLFALLLVIVAGWMLHLKLPKDSNNFICPCGLALAIGAVLGVVTGLLGVGGGFLMVPALLYLGISSMPVAVAHSLILISFNAILSGLIYHKGIELPGSMLMSIVGLAAVGSIVGSIILKRMSTQKLQRGFSIGLLLLGLAMLGKLALAATSG